LSEESEDSEHKRDSPQNGEEKSQPCTTLKLSDHKTDKFHEQFELEDENSKLNNNITDPEEDEDVED